jgi:hypothetical protein
MSGTACQSRDETAPAGCDMGDSPARLAFLARPLCLTVVRVDPDAPG